MNAMNANRPVLLKTLEYFPVAGFFIKWIMDLATNDSMTAASSIIRDSCVSLYLACMLWFLISPSSSPAPKFGIFVVFTILMIYATSIVLNASYITLIDSNLVELKSDSFWIFAEIMLLFKYMSGYVSNQDASTWLIGLLLVAMPHAWIVVTNLVNMRVRPTDDATDRRD
jgi:hypothetical protein